MWKRSKCSGEGSDVQCCGCKRKMPITITELAAADEYLCPYCSKNLAKEWRSSQQAMSELDELQKKQDEKMSNGEFDW